MGTGLIILVPQLIHPASPHRTPIVGSDISALSQSCACTALSEAIQDGSSAGRDGTEGKSRLVRGTYEVSRFLLTPTKSPMFKLPRQLHPRTYPAPYVKEAHYPPDDVPIPPAPDPDGLSGEVGQVDRHQTHFTSAPAPSLDIYPVSLFCILSSSELGGQFLTDQKRR